MKNSIVAVAATGLVAVGLLSACGSTTPVAQPVPPDKNCTDIRMSTASPGIVPGITPVVSACALLSDVKPQGVSQQRADAIVFDIRQKGLAAERAVVIFSRSNADPALVRTAIAAQNTRLNKAISDSRAALLGNPPEGFELDYKEGR